MKTNKKINLIKLFILTMSLSVMSCASDDDNTTTPEDLCFDDFSYESDSVEGPANWSNYCVSAGTQNQCGSTVRQSPINIVNAVDDTTLSALNTTYAGSRTDILNNGHTIEFEYHGDAVLNFGGTDYSLLQFHFHTGSEHTVDGVRSPLEVHLVHSDGNGGLAVIGVFFEVGTENAFLSQFTGNFPATEDERYEDDNLVYNATSLFPTNMSYFNYNGSLTTPPCSEIVEWIVMENSIQASQAQIDVFADLLHSNYRPIQPISGRTINRYAQ